MFYRRLTVKPNIIILNGILTCFISCFSQFHLSVFLVIICSTEPCRYTLEMDDFQKEFINVLSCEAFRRFLSAGIKISQLQTLLLLLIKYKIPFDLSYDPGNRRNELSIQLAIYLSPHSSINFTIGQEISEQ